MSRLKGGFLVILFSAIAWIDCYANDTLSLQQFLEVVIDYHPIIQKANLNDDISAAQILKGRGALDPKINSAYDTKAFDDTDYFRVWESEVKIPTILPLDFSIGYERNDGAFLNSENSIPSNGLVYGTLNLSILKGLLFDEQRYSLKSFELKALKSQIDKEILTREIIYQAINSYLDWSEKSNQLDINNDYIELINERHQNVVQLFENGDSPAIDTIESRLNLNTAEKLLLESESQLIKSTQSLSLFIWNENGQALELNSGIKPVQLEVLISELKELASITTNPNFISDPLIAKIDNNIEAIDLDTRLENENLKPTLDLKYNTILNLGKDNFDPTFSFNDYKYGITFQYPILNRKSRGHLRLNEAKSAQNSLDKTHYIGQLENKYVALISQEEIQENSLFITSEKLTNSELLYDAEKYKFDLGESSIFLLNSRERKLLEAQSDLIKSYISLGKVFSELYYLKMGQG